MLSEPELRHSNARTTFHRHQGLSFKSVYLKTGNDKFPQSEVFICCPYISEEPLTWKPHLELVASIRLDSNGLPPNEISVMEARRKFAGEIKRSSPAIWWLTLIMHLFTTCICMEFRVRSFQGFQN